MFLRLDPYTPQVLVRAAVFVHIPGVLIYAFFFLDVVESSGVALSLETCRSLFVLRGA